MKKVYFEDCALHDAVIMDVSCNDTLLTLYISNTLNKSGDCNLKIEMPIQDEYALDIIYLKRYFRFPCVRFKGKNPSLHFLKKLFARGYVLQIVEVLRSVDSGLVVFECDLFPYSSRKGVIKKIMLRVSYDYDYLVFKERGEESFF